jgi:uncharacterized protein
VEDELMRLPPGVAMLVSTDIERPILVDIRVRKSKHGGESVNVMRSVNLNSAQAAPIRKPPVEPVRASPVIEDHNQEEHIPVQTTTVPPPKRKPSKEVKTEEGGGLFKKIFGASK